MNVIFCRPELTLTDIEDAEIFFRECSTILDQYIYNLRYIGSQALMQQVMLESASNDDILIFFTAENGVYDEQIIKLIRKYNDAQSRIWPIAMEDAPDCRKPPEPVSDRQSFDVSCRKENRNPLKNNLKAIAQIFARKIIAQTLSPLYRDEVLYFISHRRIDGEKLAAMLMDELILLTRERKVYRDVVNVAVGDDAQQDIDEHLKISDVLIFLQTKEAQNSKYIMKELCYALLNDIPILWIQIDGAPYEDMAIRPGEGPVLKYESAEFFDPERLMEIADEVEEKCFQLMMNSSSQVYSYVECLMDMAKEGKVRVQRDEKVAMAYQVEYKEKVKDRYDSGIRKHYIQCFGRNPKEQDIEEFCKSVKGGKPYSESDRLFLLSLHGKSENDTGDMKIREENYEDYFANIQNISGMQTSRLGKRIIISGAFPDCDEIYKNSLIQAVTIYARQIIRNGYTLVFGAHPTFQQIIFDIGDLYSSDVTYSIEMHMAREFAGKYDLDSLNTKCRLIISDGLQEMREKMICSAKAEMLICLGGKIKENPSEQGVDLEVALAKKSGIPVALVGTVGGRSSEYAFELLKAGKWDEINPWGQELNEELFYNVNHRLMVEKLLSLVSRPDSRQILEE